MKVDDCSASSQPENLRDSLECRLKLPYLVVDGESESLEDTCGWVDRSVSWRYRNASPDQLNKVAGYAGVLRIPGLYDLSAEPVFPKIKEQTDRLSLWHAVDQLGGCRSGRIGSNRSIDREPESAIFPGKLRKRKRKI
jgi:hypothetical protein